MLKFHSIGLKSRNAPQLLRSTAFGCSPRAIPFERTPTTAFSPHSIPLRRRRRRRRRVCPTPGSWPLLRPVPSDQRTHIPHILPRITTHRIAPPRKCPQCFARVCLPSCDVDAAVRRLPDYTYVLGNQSNTHMTTHDHTSHAQCNCAAMHTERFKWCPADRSARLQLQFLLG